MRKLLALVIAMGAVAQASADGYTDYAKVKNVEPQYEQVKTDRQVCWNETVNVKDQRDRGGNTAGLILGGVTGAVVGHQFGKGHGKDAMTAIGAVTGAMVGRQWGNNDDRDDTYHTEQVQRCRSEPEWTQRVTGYRVTYEYAGKRYTTFSTSDPGREIKVNVAVNPIL